MLGFSLQGVVDGEGESREQYVQRTLRNRGRVESQWEESEREDRAMGMRQLVCGEDSEVGVNEGGLS